MDRIKKITDTDANAAQKALLLWNSVAKPLHSLGRLEDMIVKIAAVQGTENVSLSRCTAVIMCADHGVTARGVTQCSSLVTAKCADDIAEGRSNINMMAAEFGVGVMAVDVGIAGDTFSKKLIDKKIAPGTFDMTAGPAMTAEQCRLAVSAGIDTVKELCGTTDIIISGEMGIGNTTAASAMACVMLGEDPAALTGRGAGLDDEGLKRKTEAVRTAIEMNRPDRNDGFDILCKVGGLEIAAMTGLFLGGAIYHIPVVIDGVISAAAAAAAYITEPKAAGYMLASHCSGEPASKGLLNMIGLEPIIDGGLRLGEGTGAVLLLPLLRAALAVYSSAHRFEDIGIEQYRDLSS